MLTLLVTGGAGFIGGHVVDLALERGYRVVDVDVMNYAANPAVVDEHRSHPNYAFEQIDITDPEALDGVFTRHAPDRVMHLAAESHVDRSIDGPGAFVKTNVLGTFHLLEAARKRRASMPEAERDAFRFHHVSTDEVYGSLPLGEGRFSETSPYDPHSPYSASKAGSDHLARAWGTTYGLPVVVTNCSNNYGPRQFPEKLIPLMIIKGLAGEKLPIYGTGENVRDWLYVRDHADALLTVLERGRSGETYMIGGHSERRNIDVVDGICAALDALRPDAPHAPHAKLKSFVTDRPGHDLRYAVDTRKIESELGWRPSLSFEEGLVETVRWYLDNEDWWRALAEKAATARRGVA